MNENLSQVIGKIKAELNVKENPKQSKHLRNSFHDLVELTQVENPHFKIKGNANCFTIIGRNDNLIIALFVLAAFTYPVIKIIANPNQLLYWIISLALLLIVLLFFKFGPTTNNIKIDSETKTITISSNNLFGKFLRPKLKFNFSDFKKFSIKRFTLKGKVLNSYFNRITIHYGDKSVALIDLPDGHRYYVDHNKFINSLIHLIKKT